MSILGVHTQIHDQLEPKWRPIACLASFFHVYIYPYKRVTKHVRPPLDKELFPVHCPSGLKRAYWNFFFQFSIFFSYFPALYILVYEKKKILIDRLAVFLPTRWTGNDYSPKGGLNRHICWPGCGMFILCLSTLYLSSEQIIHVVVFRYLVRPYIVGSDPNIFTAIMIKEVKILILFSSKKIQNKRK